MLIHPFFLLSCSLRDELLQARRILSRMEQSLTKVDCSFEIIFDKINRFQTNCKDFWNYFVEDITKGYRSNVTHWCRVIYFGYKNNDSFSYLKGRKNPCQARLCLIWKFRATQMLNCFKKAGFRFSGPVDLSEFIWKWAFLNSFIVKGARRESLSLEETQVGILLITSEISLQWISLEKRLSK